MAVVTGRASPQSAQRLAQTEAPPPLVTAPLAAQGPTGTARAQWGVSFTPPRTSHGLDCWLLAAVRCAVCVHWRRVCWCACRGIISVRRMATRPPWYELWPVLRSTRSQSRRMAASRTALQSTTTLLVVRGAQHGASKTRTHVHTLTIFCCVCPAKEPMGDPATRCSTRRRVASSAVHTATMSPVTYAVMRGAGAAAAADAMATL